MASYKTDVMEKQTGSNAGKLAPSEIGGRVRIVHGGITPASAYAAGSIIELCRLPKGARILPQSQLHFEAGQDAALTVTVGDSGDADRYMSATPGASAVSLELDKSVLASYVLADEDTIILTTGVKALTSGKKIYFDIFYVVD